MPTPYRIAVPQAELDDLRARVSATRWPAPVPGDPWELGADTSTLRRLAGYWADGYDWRAHEARMNELPQFTADLDGTPVHFLHFRGQGPDPEPLIATHGWPGCFLEVAQLGERLADPARFGGDPRDAFDVVVPSLPGFGFSPPRPEATDPWSVPELWHRLMTEVLGHGRYGVHGGDLGAGVSSRIGARHPEAVTGVHVLAVGSPAAESLTGLSEAEEAYLAQVRTWERDEGGYEHEQRTRPVTLAHGLSDSPVGLLAWLVEKYRAWSDCDGDLARRFSDDDVLTWVSLYWLTNSIGPSFRPYSDHSDHQLRQPGPVRVEVPTALAVFPRDLVQPPREWAERTHRVERYTRMAAGGHFAAFEEPGLLARDLTEFFRDLRARR